MLKYFFTERGHYGKYAATLAAGMLTYLVTGFALAKWIFEDEAILSTPSTLAFLVLGAGVFAFIHVSSMKDLDSTNKKKSTS